MAVSRIVLHGGGAVHELPLDHPQLTNGWWRTEQAGAGICRWTDGDALFPVPPETTLIEIGLAGS